MPNKRFLVDTSAWILALKPNGISEIKNQIGQLLADEILYTTGIINLELLGGTKTRKEFMRLKGHLAALDMIETDNEIWESAYDLAFKLRRRGITIPHTDILIAACGLAADATVVHVDIHFEMIRSKHKLKTENLLHHVKNINPDIE